jgi:hypothetical protein
MLTTGKQSQVGLNAVLRQYADGAQNELKEVVKGAWAKDRLYWTRRPLSEEMVRYASLDVAFLLKAFDRMAAGLEQKALLEPAIVRSRLHVDCRRSPAAADAASAESLVAGVGEEREIVKECRITQDAEDLDVILDALPEHLREALRADKRLPGLVEIVLDLGRPLMARFSGAGMPRVAQIGRDEISALDLEQFSHTITKFDSENRHGPPVSPPTHTRPTTNDTTNG